MTTTTQASRCQDKRQEMENQERMARLRHGLLGLWDRVTGKQVRIQKHNEIEALQAFHRDRAEKDALIFRQLDERQNLQERIDREKETYAHDMQHIREAVFSKLPEDKIRRIQPEFDRDIQACICKCASDKGKRSAAGVSD